MLAFGGAVTLNNLIIYVAYNADKVLIGRFWGAAALGIYGRAYQLINMPNENLYSTIGVVAFPALSRVQADPARSRSAFLKGYNLFLSLVMPITVGCALFADDIVLLFLGPKWHDAATIFRLLAPATLGFAFINPFAWLMLAGGRVGRFLKIAMIFTPVLILSYWLGLRNGPRGVAIGFSIGMAVCTIPFQLWAKHGTLIALRDLFKAMAPSVTSIVMGAAVTFASQSIVHRLRPPFGRLVAESAILFGVYLLTLLFIMKQQTVYAGLLRQAGLTWTTRSRRPEATAKVSAL